MTKKVALVAGATGIVGSNLCDYLARKGWEVHGVARNPLPKPGIHGVTADLLSPASIEKAAAAIRPTHVFITTWLRQSTEAENIKVNSAMVRNLLAATAETNTVQHVALVTGLKHYLGPFEAYGKGAMPPTPFRETESRLDLPNFYYAQEDEVFRAAKEGGYGWSVHRPHTIIGYAIGNAMNMGVTLAVYASLCKESRIPFRFPGSAAQWNGLSDMTDARLLARHLEWVAATEGARNQAFNVVNGDVFRWSWMWKRIAGFFGIEPAPFDGETRPLEPILAGRAEEWRSLAKKHGLAEENLATLASAWHTDADLGRPIEVMADMTKSRKLGFLDYQATDESFFQLFTLLRERKIIP